jgi:hypothetical protein
VSTGTTRTPIAPAEGLVVAYLGAVALVGLLPALGVSPDTIVSATAFSPADLASGKLWLLPASGIVVAGDTWPQLAALAQLAAVILVVADGKTFWRAAIAGHVGSTLVAYAIVAVLAIVAPTTVHGLFDAPDYGISCVWAGALGGLAVVLCRSGLDPRVRLLAFAGQAVPVIVVLRSGFVNADGTLALASVEHALAFMLGAGVTWRALRHASAAPRRALRARASHRPGELPGMA